MKTFLEKLSNRQDLTFEESKAAFEILMNGNHNIETCYKITSYTQKIVFDQLYSKAYESVTNLFGLIKDHSPNCLYH